MKKVAPKSTQLGAVNRDEEVSLNFQHQPSIASLGSGEARCDIFNNHEEAVPDVIPQASAGAGARFHGLNAGDK